MDPSSQLYLCDSRLTWDSRLTLLLLLEAHQATYAFAEASAIFTPL